MADQQQDMFGGGGRIVRVGHAGRCGAGPEGETCGSCDHLRVNITGSRKRFYKCGHIRGHITRGEATDVRLKDMACEWWEPLAD